MYRKKSRLSGIVCLFINFVAIFLSFNLAILIREGLGLGKVAFGSTFKACGMIILIWGFLYFFINSFHHFFKRNMFEELLASIRLNFYAFFLFLAMWYFLELEHISRVVLILFFLLNVVLVWYTNILYKKFLFRFIKGRKNTNRCILLVNEDRAQEVIDNIL